MSALVPELVHMASNPAISTPDLLRRALVVARRLSVPELVDWLNCELHGYGVDKEVPAYRKLVGNVLPAPGKGESQAVSRINPIELERLFKAASEFNVIFSASVIEGIASKKEELLVDKFSPYVDYLLKTQHIGNFTLVRTTSPIQYRGILDAVKTKILNWALDLEDRKIIGEGMSFTPKEKQAVQQIHNHFGNVSGSQVQINSNGSTQTQTNTTNDLEALKGLIKALGVMLDNSQDDLTDELRAELATLKAQAESPKPKWEIIKATARSIKSVAEGATGNLLAGLAQPHLTALMTFAAA